MGEQKETTGGLAELGQRLEAYLENAAGRATIVAGECVEVLIREGLLDMENASEAGELIERRVFPALTDEAKVWAAAMARILAAVGGQGGGS